MAQRLLRHSSFSEPAACRWLAAVFGASRASSSEARRNGKKAPAASQGLF
jgi:hypothetical protein